MYSYENEKRFVFTEEGQRGFLKVRDNMYHHCKLSGAVGFWQATRDSGIGDSWSMIACVDRLVELGEFECIYDRGMTQNRIYRAVSNGR